MLKLKNTQPGPRGVNAVSGPVLVAPDETVEVDVYQREKEHLEATGWFEIKGTYKANPDGASAPASVSDAGLAERAAQIQKVFDEREAASRKAVEDAQKQADEALAAKADADKAIADRDAEIADLKKQIEASKKGGK